MLAGLARWIGFLTMSAGAVGALLLAVGFFWFAANIPTDDVSLERKADGIVVLTGAASRIPDAIELLAAERGQRLLITGVHRATSAQGDRAADAALFQVLHLLHRSRSLGAQHLRQRHRDQALGARAQFQFADRGDLELAPAARHG